MEIYPQASSETTWAGNFADIMFLGSSESRSNLEHLYLPNLLATAGSVSVFQTFNLPFDPPQANKKGISSENDTEKIAPSFGFSEATHDGWLFDKSQSFTILSVEPVARKLGVDGAKDMDEAAFSCACRVNVGWPGFEFEEAVRLSNA